MSKQLYNLFLLLYGSLIRVVAIWNPKARLWVNGRKNQFRKIESGIENNNAKTLWMHCASLGEFEQGRPVLESIKKEYPSYKVVLTFFSPSGYEIRKNYQGADHVFYLPSDSFVNAKRFIKIINPSLVIWVKYDYWYYYLTRINKQKIPLLLVAANFRESQPFFKWYGGLWKKMLSCFSQIFVQTRDSIELLISLGINNAIISGDTRFDRVITIAESTNKLPGFINDFTKNAQVIVCGSTWPEDEFQWLHFVQNHPMIKFIFAPHEIDASSIHEVQEKYPAAILYSAAEKDPENIEGKQVLIVDNIGKLSSLYSFATLAYVGGGFNESGIHNTLEAAVYGKPVIFGPQYEKFTEANGLIESGAAFSINTPVALEKQVNNLLENHDILIAAGNAAKDFVYQNQGATNKILLYIQENRLLTN